MNWQDLFEPSIIQRGIRLADSGAVSIISNEPGEIVAKVQGSDLYDVRITRDKGMITSMECSCPYPHNCKHQAATLYSLEQKAQPERFNFYELFKEKGIPLSRHGGGTLGYSNSELADKLIKSIMVVCTGAKLDEDKIKSLTLEEKQDLAIMLNKEIAQDFFSGLDMSRFEIKEWLDAAYEAIREEIGLEEYQCTPVIALVAAMIINESMKTDKSLYAMVDYIWKKCTFFQLAWNEDDTEKNKHNSVSKDSPEYYHLPENYQEIIDGMEAEVRIRAEERHHQGNIFKVVFTIIGIVLFFLLGTDLMAALCSALFVGFAFYIIVIGYEGLGKDKDIEDMEHTLIYSNYKRYIGRNK